MCDICRQTPCDCRCPSYMPKASGYFCDRCGEVIYEKEKYVMNDVGKYCHMDCFFEVSDVLAWLGYNIETME